MNNVFFVVGCVGTPILAGSSKFANCTIHLLRLHLSCRVCSFCFWTPSYTCTYAQACKQTQLQVLHVKPFTNTPLDLYLLYINSSIQNELAFFQTHHAHKYTHSNIYIDTLRSWFWMLWPTLEEIYEAGSLLSCVSLTWYYFVSKPQLSTEAESWSGDRGNERGWKIDGNGVVRK